MNRGLPAPQPLGLPTLVNGVDPLASASPSIPDIHLTLAEGFHRPEIPKQLSYSIDGFQLQPPTHYRGRHWRHFTYPDAASSVAITGLSYTTIQSACAPWYRLVQISPPRLTAVSRCACSPPAGGKSDGLPPPLSRIFTSSHVDRVPLVSALNASPFGPFPCRPISPLRADWVERDISVPSARCSAASPITGTALQRMLDWNG